jgi:hypothetical protein
VVCAIWLIDLDVLDRDHGLHRVHHPVVGDGGHIHAHVVLGDDALRLDGHGDDPQGHPMEYVDDRDDDP